MIALLVSCTEPAPDVGSPTPVVATVDGTALAGTWQVQMTDDATRAPFEAHAGWAQVFQRDYPQALKAFADHPMGQARIHLEMAALYRQATMLAAHSTVQVYKADHRDTDPADVAYLVAVSRRLLGEAGAVPVPQVEAWKPRAVAWNADAWPPAAILSLMPDDGGLPQSVGLQEQGEGGGIVEALDPTELFWRSAFHEGQARSLVDQGGWIDAWLAPWQLPAEPTRTGSGEVPPEALFAGFATNSADVWFWSEACDTGSFDALKNHPESPMALALSQANEKGFSVDTVLDAGLGFRKQLLEQMNQTGEKDFQRAFADIAEVGLVQAATCLAPKDIVGLLRVAAWDLSQGPSSDPRANLSLAAWDAGNRNALRSLQLLHSLTLSMPEFQVARVPLDAMSVRLSRNTAPTKIVH